MLIYLDNCCYNRPYDNQNDIRISLETQAKLYIQYLIKANQIDLASSFMIEFENDKNPYSDRKNSIREFIILAKIIVELKNADDVFIRAFEIEKSGVQFKDACHVACAEIAKCDYLISTDKRLIKCSVAKVPIINPFDFIDVINTNGGVK